jgi:hypothetical protein
MAARPTDFDPDNALAKTRAPPSFRRPRGENPRQARVSHRGVYSPAETDELPHSWGVDSPAETDELPHSMRHPTRLRATKATHRQARRGTDCCRINTSEFTRGFHHSSTKTKHTEVRLAREADGQAHLSGRFPRRGHGSILRRPKATEASEPS